MFLQMLFVAFGGAGGALCRYGMTNLINHYVQSHFPFATLAVNAIGSFVMGVMYVVILERMVLHPDWRSVIIVGFLGAFTTFSTFSLEAVNLLQHGYLGTALAYMLLSVLICITAAWSAMVLTRLL